MHLPRQLTLWIIATTSAFYLGYEGADSVIFQKLRYRLQNPGIENGDLDSDHISWEDQNMTVSNMANVGPRSTIRSYRQRDA